MPKPHDGHVSIDDGWCQDPQCVAARAAVLAHIDEVSKHPETWIRIVPGPRRSKENKDV